MNRVTRVIHPVASIAFAPIAELAPDLTVTTAGESNGHGAPELAGLMFTDPDGESHLYLFDQAGKQRLLQTITGSGLVITDRIPPTL